MSKKLMDMTAGNPTKLIFRFSLPLMVGNIFQQCYTIVDAIIVGQGVGVDALAAVGASDWINWMLLWMMQGLAQGCGVLVAQYFGAKELDALRTTVTMSILLCGVSAVLLTAVGLLAARPMLMLLQTPSDILEEAFTYLFILFSGTLVVMAYNVFSSILRALGDGKTPLVAMAIAGGINIVLDLVFVLVFHWGIAGAAIATIIAQLFSAVYCFISLRRVPILRFTKKDWRLDRSLLAQLGRLGVPIALQNGIIAVGGMAVQYVLNGFGTLFIAGFTATNKMYGILECSAISFGYAMNTYMGQNMGARRLDRIKSGIRSVLGLSVGFSVVIGFLAIVFGRNLLSLFVSSADANHEKVLDIAYQYLFIMAALMLILYLLHAYRSSLQGLGNTRMPMVSGFIETVMRVGVALAGPLLLGEFGIFLCEPMAWTGAAVFLMIMYYHEVRKVERQFHMQEMWEVSGENSTPDR